MKVNKNGEYNVYAKTMDNDKMNEIADTVETIVKQAIENINNCEFDINPKYIEKKVDGCAYCEYSNICYKSLKDYINLEAKKAGDSNAMD